MIIWSGRGLNVIAAIFLAGLVVFIGGMMMTGSDNLLEENDGAFGMMLLLAGVTCWFIGRRWAKEPPQVLVDPKTGQQIVYQKHDTFFYLSVQSWGVILSLVGATFIIHEFAGGGESWIKAMGSSSHRRH